MSGLPLPLGAQQAALEYTKKRLDEKAIAERTVAAERARILEWQRGLEQDKAGKTLPTQKPLPPLPQGASFAAEKTSKKEKVKKWLGLGKKEEDCGVDFSQVFGCPITGPREMREDDEEITALPAMPVRKTE